ncbi:MAG TPA: LytTR family DNA-binding domain-containing protein [Pedomonas sp.]|uniref:LytR/AlgR family response regulator transcription factor n=1 Tax=Pedomonas sp. TaxID=2976421 RepID=UPI002F4244A5
MSDVLRILLADDEPLALERLVFALRDIEGTEVVATASNGLEAAQKIIELKPDVAILDIQMPGRTGLGIAAGLDPADRPEIIFVTAYEHHAVDAFDVEAADYVLKPLRLDRLRQAIERVRRRRSSRGQVAPADAAHQANNMSGDEAFWVQGRHGLVRVGIDELDWIEAAKDYVLLHTPTRSHILRATMGAIETRVAPCGLIRVHRSAIVRPGAVRSLQHSANGAATLVLDGGIAVPVGPSYLPEVMKRFVRT